jgi:hypothetical protein
MEIPQEDSETTLPPITASPGERPMWNPCGVTGDRPNQGFELSVQEKQELNPELSMNQEAGSKNFQPTANG